MRNISLTVMLLGSLATLGGMQPAISVAATTSVNAEQNAALEPVRREVRLRNFERAIELLKPLAQAGNVEAQYMLANFYRSGRGAKKDEQLAAQWFEKASQQGHGKATYNLATLFEHGRGVKKDRARAQLLYQQAAQAGHPLAKRKINPDAAAKDPRLKAQGVMYDMPSLELQLRTAVRKADADAVRELLAQKVAVNKLSKDERKQLLDATETGSLAVVTLLRNAGTVNKLDKYGRTLLLDATETGSLAVVTLLLNTGVDINKGDRFGNTPLLKAAEGGHLSIVDALLSRGADPAMMDQHGNTALHLAAANGTSRPHKPWQNGGLHSTL